MQRWPWVGLQVRRRSRAQCIAILRDPPESVKLNKVGNGKSELSALFEVFPLQLHLPLTGHIEQQNPLKIFAEVKDNGDGSSVLSVIDRSWAGGGQNASAGDKVGHRLPVMGCSSRVRTG